MTIFKQALVDFLEEAIGVGYREIKNQDGSWDLSFNLYENISLKQINGISKLLRTKNISIESRNSLTESDSGILHVEIKNAKKSVRKK